MQDRVSAIKGQMKNLQDEDRQLIEQIKQKTNRRNQIHELLTASQGALVTLEDLLKEKKEEVKEEAKEEVKEKK